MSHFDQDKRHCEERSDEAIPNPAGDCFAPFGRSQ
jgi:hypothetical protein